MARIGIYGGTFNPIHNTHIEIAEAALKQYNLDKVYFLIAGEPPHKDTADTVTVFNRVDMVRLAIKGHSSFDIDLREVYRAGKSYSYITLSEYKSQYPDDELFFIMGSDSFLAFKDWVKPEKISSCATILVAPRQGDKEQEITRCRDEYRNHFSGDFELINYICNDVASSFIREAVSQHRVDELDTLNCVKEYIIEHNLYSRTYNNDDVSVLLKNMKDELKNSRFIHTVGVADTAYALALKWNYPAYNAMVAGVLHDCAKCMSDDKRIDICKKNRIEISKIEGKFPHLLHGKVGAFLAKEKYGIKDDQITHAISIHTTGCPNMNLLDKIIFVADYIEPGRDKQPRLDTLRKVAYEDLDLCVYMILEDTVNYLNENPDSIDPTTMETFDYYKKERGI